MKRPQPAMHRRPASAIARRPRTRTEAAIELVRAEFERERLDRDLALLERRAALSAETRDACKIKSRNLRAQLAEGDAREAAEERRR